jgi:AcrR family transcriptional regulator
MKPTEREAAIVVAATAYFAEAGFGGTTRELAQRIGISQPLLYRYFPTKEALVDRVYEHAFERSWRPEWDALLNGEGPADARISAFYADYVRVILQRQWIRLFLLSGLRGYDIPARFIRMLRGRVFRPVVAMLRADMGLPEEPATEAELEMVWGLHGSLVYLGVRQSVFDMRMPMPLEALAEQQVRMFLGGFRSLAASRLTRVPAHA